MGERRTGIEEAVTSSSNETTRFRESGADRASPTPIADPFPHRSAPRRGLLLPGVLPLSLPSFEPQPSRHRHSREWWLLGIHYRPVVEAYSFLSAIAHPPWPIGLIPTACGLQPQPVRLFSFVPSRTTQSLRFFPLLPRRLCSSASTMLRRSAGLYLITMNWCQASGVRHQDRRRGAAGSVPRTDCTRVEVCRPPATVQKHNKAYHKT